MFNQSEKFNVIYSIVFNTKLSILKSIFDN